MKVTAGLLAAYGALTVAVAVFANGPAQGDLLSKWGGAVPWYGLSAVGALAALTWLLAYRNDRVLVVSAVCLVAWTACYWLGTDQGVELNAASAQSTPSGASERIHSRSTVSPTRA
jgi:hypothetical protein